MDLGPSKSTAHITYLVPAAVILLLGLARLLGWKPSTKIVIGTAVVIGGALALAMWDYPSGADYYKFWLTGKVSLEGQNPYFFAEGSTKRTWMVSPPNSVPLFEMFALLPFEASRLTWTLINVALIALIVPACNGFLKRSQDGPRRELALPDVLLLSMCVLMSLPARMSMGLGQLAGLVTIAICAGLYLRERSWPWLAGAVVALAAIKPQTALPFMLLFLLRKEWKVLAAATIVTAVLCLMSGPPAELIRRLGQMLSNVAVLTEPGRMNDPVGSKHAATMIGFDRLLFGLGVTDRGLLRGLQTALVLIAGAWVAWAVTWGKLSRVAGASLVAIYTMMFTYHRTHDALILALPFVYCAACAFDERLKIPARRWHRATAVMMLLVLFLHPNALELVSQKVAHVAVVGPLAWALIMPATMWVLLISMWTFWMAERASLALRGDTGETPVVQNAASY